MAKQKDHRSPLGEVVAATDDGNSDHIAVSGGHARFLNISMDVAAGATDGSEESLPAPGLSPALKNEACVPRGALQPARTREQCVTGD